MAREGTCINYSSPLMHQECKAGINYIELAGGERFGYVKRLPCRKDFESSISCDCFQEPTPEQVEDQNQWIEKKVEQMKLSIPLISEIKKEHGMTDAKGTKECPVCGGTLHYTVSEYNGHVWGSCETKDCLQWME